MKKALFLFSIVLLFCYCDDKVSHSDKSSHRVNNVAVIIDDLLWNGEIGDTLRQKFASPVVGLPQEEPLFTLNQYPVKLLEGYMSHSRNIIVIKKGPRRNFEIKSDEYTVPQTVVYISGRNTTEVIDVIQQNASEIISTIKRGEIECIQNEIAKSVLDKKRIANKFNIEMQIPQQFKYVAEGENFLWLKKDVTSGNSSIVIYQVPLDKLMPKADIVNNVIKLRDSISQLYIHGSSPGTTMVTENSYAPYLFNTKISGLETFEIRGTWELDRNMSGPFVNYAIIDSVNSRALIIEGFCHIPSKQKRDLIFELEAIISSTKIINQ